MKKRIQLFFLLVGMAIICFCIVIHKDKQIRLEFNEKGEVLVKVSADSMDLEVIPWWNEEDNKYYVFLPSFCDDDEIYVSDVQDFKLYINEDQVKNKDKYSFVEEKEYCFELVKNNDKFRKYNFVFIKSRNVPAVFISTASGNLNYLLENKENAENAKISVVREKGNVEYSGGIEKISGRGNSTWDNYSKKSFSMTLYNKESLCGLEDGKNWILLAIHGEGNKMTTKLTMEMSEYLKLEPTMNNTWVDVYFNGTYNGMYLLSEAVKISESGVSIYDLEKENKKNNGDLDVCSTFTNEVYKGYELPNVSSITGGFLIEKDFESYYNTEKVGFKTDLGNCFSIKSPQHAAQEQVEYIYNYINMIEKRIVEHDASILQYVDMESFAKYFLIQEIILNADANVTSVYFYKDRNDDKLYAGPIWDCDLGMGLCNTGWMEGNSVNYKGSINIAFRNERLIWYQELYKEQNFYDLVRSEFLRLLPFMEVVLEEKIDDYYNMIKHSVEIDALRWGREDLEGRWIDNYQSYENNIRYMKYYLVNRLNYLMDLWEIPYQKFEFDNSEEEHLVQYMVDGIIVETRMIVDGQEIKELPYLDEAKYWGWYYTYNNLKTREWLPVLEDCTFYAREK